MKIYVTKTVYKQIIGVLIALSIITLLCVYQTQAKIGIISGLTASCMMVFPSLFPFIVACNLLYYSGGIKFLSRIMNFPAKLMMGNHYQLFSIYIMSVIGGYPVGAVLLDRMVQTGQLDCETARRALLFCINPSPSFVILAVGDGMLFSKSIGILLFYVNLFASFLSVLYFTRLLPWFNKSENVNIKSTEYYPASFADSFVDAVYCASKSILYMCSFVVLFYSLNEIIASMPINNIFGAIISGVLEVTSSCAMLSSGGAHIAFISAVLSFGGFCVHFQIVSSTKNFKPKYSSIFITQLIKGIISFLLTYLVCQFFPDIVKVNAQSALTTLSESSQISFSVSPLVSISIVLTAIALLFSFFSNDNSFEKDIV